MTIICYIQPLINGIFVACKNCLENLENLDKFNNLQNFHLTLPRYCIDILEPHGHNVGDPHSLHVQRRKPTTSSCCHFTHGINVEPT